MTLLTSRLLKKSHMLRQTVKSPFMVRLKLTTNGWGHTKGQNQKQNQEEPKAERSADGRDLSWPAIGWAQARRDRQNGGTTENVIGELGLFADEGTSSERERASSKSSEDGRRINKQQKADLTSFGLPIKGK